MSRELVGTDALARKAWTIANALRERVKGSLATALNLGKTLAEKREELPSDREYGTWLKANDYFGFDGADWLRRIRIVAEHFDELPLRSDFGVESNALSIDALYQQARALEIQKNPPISKPQLGSERVSHPARFSTPILDVIAAELPEQGIVLDPFAGTGRIHELATDTRQTVGVEIEAEWADLHPDTRQGNALDLASADIAPGTVDAVATSPTYGNRLADSHKAADPDARRSYTHDLGHALHDDNSGDLQWGDEYRRFHEAAYREAITALKPGGRMVVNISDHIRGGEWQAVSYWHLHILTKLGLEWGSVRRVETRRLRQGENSEARAEYEYVIVMTKEEQWKSSQPKPASPPTK